MRQVVTIIAPVRLPMLMLGLLVSGCGSELGGQLSNDADAAVDSEVAVEIPDAKEVRDSDDAGPDDADGADLDVLDSIEDTSDDGDVAGDTGGDSAEPDSTGDTLDDAGDVPLVWRSELYPEHWLPGLAGEGGAALQDYSYAGYHNGRAAPGAGLGTGGVMNLVRFSVLDYGAVPVSGPPELASDNSAAFQAAIDAADAAGGGLVFVPEGLYRIDIWLEVRSSRVVIKGEGPARSRLWFTRKVGLDYGAHLRFAGDEDEEVEVALAADAARFDSWVAVSDATALQIGEDVVLGELITATFLEAHGMTGQWGGALDTWQPVYRRTIVGVDRASTPHRVKLDVPIRAALRVGNHATLRRVSGLLREVGLEDIAIANAIDWKTAWGGDQIAAVAFDHVADAWVRNVQSFPSPGAPTFGMGAGAHLQSNGILVASSKRVTIADTHLAAAQNRGGGGNGYLFEIRQSNEVLLRDSSARAGRHNVVLSRGLGTNGCVVLRMHSSDGHAVPLGPIDDTEVPARSELHSLATANLIDQSVFEDSLDAMNRDPLVYDSGHSATECVLWNFTGPEVISLQFGLGYVIGSGAHTRVTTSLRLSGAEGTEPEDWVEGDRQAATLAPSSLYEDQLARRLDEIRP